MNLVVEYYQAAFAHLHERLHERANQVLPSEPASIRSKYLTEHLLIGEEISAESAWLVARQLLDVLEAEMAAILRKRSVFFWLHIYRRIGVILNPLHEDKTDPRTLGLVRQIAELAISKHGRATDAREIVRSDRVNPDLILGGLIRVGVKRLATKRPSLAYRNFAKLIRAQPQLVIRDFSEEDFLGIYRVEGLAYQYWRVTALLRSLGKGAGITINHDGNWDYVPNEELTWLLENIDARTNRGGFDNSLIGIWVDENMTGGEEGEKRAFDFLICPIYNVSRIKLGDALRTLGLCFPQEFTSNFVPVLVNIRNFLGAHDFLSDTFCATQGYRLEAIVSVLWAIGNILIIPEPYLLTETEEGRLKIFRDTMMNVLQRGYGVYDFDAKKLTPRLQRRIKLFSSDINVTDDEIQAILNRITLTPERQRSISLWEQRPAARSDTGRPASRSFPAKRANYAQHHVRSGSA